MPAAAHDNTPRAGTSDGPTGTSDTTAGSMYAFDPRETPIVGKRSREWIAVGPSELRCLLADGAVPGGATGGSLAEVAKLNNVGRTDTSY